jgi:hypothetical protein
VLDSSLEIEQAEIRMPKPLPGTQIFKLPPRRVVILATPSAHSLEVAGPFEVFAMASVKLHEAGRERMSGYSVEVVSASDNLRTKGQFRQISVWIQDIFLRRL